MTVAAPVLTVRVSTVRRQNPYGRGGAIFTGIGVDDKGWRTDAKTHYVIKASGQMLQAPVERGQVWRVVGTPELHTIVVNGYRLTEATVTPEAMELVRPSGEHIITLLGEGEAFVGIGEVKARRLWEHFGEALYEVLDRGDVRRLAQVLPKPMAERLANAWHRWGDTFTLQWLQSKGFSVPLGRKVLAFYGREAAGKIEEDPYRLISFAASWQSVDALAQDTFGLSANDSRRLAGAVEEALYAAFDEGHTCLPQGQFTHRLASLLGINDATVLAQALAEAEAARRFIRRGDALHAPGPYVMESFVAEAIAIRVAHPEPLLSSSDLSELIADYQAETSGAAGDPGFALHAKQIEALEVASANPMTVITGGAGTGKTTVLRGLFRLCEAAGHAVYPMALSGRAAKRIGEATGRTAQTIAGFLKHFDPKDAPTQAVVVIDEASMVDLPSIYRMIRRLPPRYRLVLVGDPHQLPPVGPGLLLHELAHQHHIPVVELSQVKRYGGAIADAAALIRAGHWPELPDDPEANIAFLPCPVNQINALVLRLYQEDRGASQILCATRNAPGGGIKAINALCQRHCNSSGEESMIWNADFDRRQGTGLRVGDPVICLRNNWEIDLQNGSLGIIVSVAAPTRADERARCLGRILWDDGETRDLTADLLPHLDLAYAITIHKAQGSGFRRVLIPVRPSKLLDRTLLYTAVTRAEQQVVLVGDVEAARAAVRAPRHSERRQVALGALLRERIGAI